MDCNHVQTLLVSYLNHEVSPSERALIRAHVSGCPVCQGELALLAAVQRRVSSAMQRRAAHLVPSPGAWSRLEARLAAPGEDARPGRVTGIRGTLIQLFSGETPVSKKFILAGSVVVLAITLIVISMFNSVTPVSAQAILDHAHQNHAQAGPADGIEHVRSEIYTNLEALPDGQGLETTLESFFDLQTGHYRVVTTDNKTGQVFYVSAYDGANTYAHDGGKLPVGGTPLTVYRTPQEGPAGQKPRLRGDDMNAKALFDQMRMDPGVQFVGQESWPDGRTVYALRSQQPIKVMGSENTIEHPMGFVTLYFEVETFKLSGSRVTMEKDGQEVLISAQRILVDEILPAGSSVAWDLSDLQGITLVDEAAQAPAMPVAASVEDLAANTRAAYLLETVPDGFSLEIGVMQKQAAGEPYAYTATYRSESNEYFMIRTWPEALQDTAWADEVYTTTSGLVLYLIAEPGTTAAGKPITVTSALMQTPEGAAYSLRSTLPRETLKAWAETLAPVR